MNYAIKNRLVRTYKRWVFESAIASTGPHFICTQVLSWQNESRLTPTLTPAQPQILGIGPTGLF
jgi:hypothetical protein